MKKYFYSFLRYFLLYLVGFIAFYVFNFLLSSANAFLSEAFPAIFKVYNPITSREELIRQNGNIALLSAILSVLALTVIAVRHDNLRYEFLISKTDGLYSIREGFALYASNFLRADIISAIAVPLSTLGLTLIKIPEDAPRFLKVMHSYLEIFLKIPDSFTEKGGLIIGGVLLLLISLLSRLPAVLLGLLHWRGSWLANTEE